jgi:hypothetical protein
MFVQTLAFGVEAEPKWSGLRLIAVDATCLSGPGAKTTDQKLHTVYDLCRGCPISVDLTDRFGGEALWRHSSFGKGDIVLADAGYGHHKSFMHALESGAEILIRFNFGATTLLDELRDRVSKEDADAQIPMEGCIERIVFMPGWGKPLRVIGYRNDLDEQGWLLTSLNRKQLPTRRVRDLYRRRWQVELYFKRLKSLLDLDELPSRDGPTARPWIWTKLILASLGTLMAYERFSPWEAGTQEDQDHRHSKPLASRRLRTFVDGKSAPPTRRKTQTRQTQRQTNKAKKSVQTAFVLEA